MGAQYTSAILPQICKSVLCTSAMNPKDLDPSCKMDLDLWDSFGRDFKMDLDLWDYFEGNFKMDLDLWDCLEEILRWI